MSETKKKTWNCYGEVRGGKYLGEVEAATKEEAEALALELDTLSVALCHHCSSQVEDPEVTKITVEADD